MLIKQKRPSLLRNFSCKTFGKLLIVFSIKVALLYFLCSMARRCQLLHLIKQNCLLKSFLRTLSKNSNQMSLPVFPSGTNLKLYKILVSPKMLKKVITNLDSSKTPGPDCIPVVVVKNCQT